MYELEINKAIYSLLSGVTSTIHPLVIPLNSNLPAIVYERNSSFNYTNFGYSSTDSIISITIIAEEYEESINIANSVNSILNNYSGAIEGFNIKSIRLQSISEDFIENSFIQKIDYLVKHY